MTIVDLRDSPVNPDAVGYVKIPGTVGEIALVNPSTLAICAQTDLLLCDLQLNKTVQTPCVGGRPVSIAVSPNADLIVCGTSAGWVVAFGSTDGALRWKTRISVHAFERDPQAISGVAFLDHGSTVAASSRDGHLHFLTSEDGSSLDSVQISARSLTAVATLGEGSRIATCGDEGLFTYDRSRGLVTHQKKQHRGKGVICLSTTRTGELLASSGLDHSVTLWRTRDMEPLCALEVEEIATALAFDEDGSRLAVGTESGLVLVLNLIEK